MSNRNKTIDKSLACVKCLRPKQQCICERVRTVANRHRVLILQYPREQYKLLGSARLTSMVLSNSVLRVGLSWPNLRKAVGMDVSPSRWGVLYLGSAAGSDQLVQVLDRKKQPAALEGELEGIVAIDGSWKQAKSLWWRNAWLLKLKRIVLNPKRTSLRAQTRQEALSTAEAVALALEGLGEDRNVYEPLRVQYETLIIQPNNQS